MIDDLLNPMHPTSFHLQSTYMYIRIHKCRMILISILLFTYMYVNELNYYSFARTAALGELVVHLGNS